MSKGILSSGDDFFAKKFARIRDRRTRVQRFLRVGGDPARSLPCGMSPRHFPLSDSGGDPLGRSASQWRAREGLRTSCASMMRLSGANRQPSSVSRHGLRRCRWRFSSRTKFLRCSTSQQEWSFIPLRGTRTGLWFPGCSITFGSLSQIGGVKRPGIVHRLDKETSGCLVVAKSDAAHQLLAAQFAGREVSQSLSGTCFGITTLSRGVVDAPIARRSCAPQENGRSRNCARSRSDHRVSCARVQSGHEPDRMPTAHRTYPSDSRPSQVSGLSGSWRSALRASRQFFASYAARVETRISPSGDWSAPGL